MARPHRTRPLRIDGPHHWALFDSRPDLWRVINRLGHEAFAVVGPHEERASTFAHGAIHGATMTHRVASVARSAPASASVLLRATACARRSTDPAITRTAVALGAVRPRARALAGRSSRDARVVAVRADGAAWRGLSARSGETHGFCSLRLEREAACGVRGPARSFAATSDRESRVGCLLGVEMRAYGGPVIQPPVRRGCTHGGRL